MCRTFQVFLFVAGTIVILVFAAPAIEAGGGGHGGCVPREGSGNAVLIQNNCFTPAVLYVQPGATVEWQQRDPVPHNVTLVDGEVVGGDGALDAGDSVSRVFDRLGVFAYYCSIHPAMLGVVVAGDPASPAFGAGLSFQPGEESQAAGNPQVSKADHVKGSDPGGFKWAEAAAGFGLVGGLLVGLVAVGGGLRRRRSG
jgi:plastocyanin